jgi:hypothetical protein
VLIAWWAGCPLLKGKAFPIGNWPGGCGRSPAPPRMSLSRQRNVVGRWVLSNRAGRPVPAVDDQVVVEGL